MKASFFAAVLGVLQFSSPSLEAIEPKLDVSKQMETVERIRGLEFTGPVIGFEIDENELRDRLRAMLNEQLPVPPDQYARVLAALHLLEEERDDPIRVLLELYQGQVLAFYDPAIRRFYSVKGAGGPLVDFAGMEDVVIVHELVHALQDQRYDAGAILESREDDWDSSLAYHALLEGEAMLVMLGSVADIDEIISNDELLKMMSTLGPAAAALGLDDVPDYFIQSMIFPYSRGLEVMAKTYENGGWSAIDRLYEAPPLSTSQLLHHDERPPVAVDLPGVSGAVVESTFGEFHWTLLVGADAAMGWRGDRFAVIDEDSKLTVIADTRWANQGEAEEFAEALEEALSGGEPFLEIVVDGSAVRAGWGASEETIDAFVVRGLNRETGD